MYTALKRLTSGTSRDIVDTSKSAGEAWYRLKDKFHSRTAQGATAIATQMTEIKRPTNIADSYKLMNLIRKLVDEFSRQSPLEPLPKSIVKAAYMKVVPEAYR